jgi:hypothetical protein
MIDGRKYITNGKPKNGKKKNVESIIEPLLFASPAPSDAVGR